MVEACSKVGTPQHIASIQASIWGEQIENIIKAQNENFKEALATLQQNNSTTTMVARLVEGQCYQCGKQGHFKKNCPKLAKTAKLTGCLSKMQKRKASADRNKELTVLAKSLRPPLIIPQNTSIAKAIAMPSHAVEQDMPVFHQQDFPLATSGDPIVDAVWSPIVNDNRVDPD
ncbi:hypothetical protein DUI87_00985 [Hirundo rustica rustica]|uniref:CCHC-type domain-containing protein n=1 Tax=Hirundo rustica rustica TaxID=333673 RepID=A0A3M0L3M6_HIRRU|nr:hypothetical protein DUI87_00985 [Hirundo rustica rustica]